MARAEKVIVLGLSGALLLLSVFSAYVEARPFLLRGHQEQELVNAFLTLSKERLSGSLFDSGRARSARLNSCLRSLTLAVGQRGPARASAFKIAEACLTIAEANVAHSPLSSNDWLLAAVLAQRLGQIERAKRYLDASFRTGPNEQWIAERRALFAHQIRDRLDSELLKDLDRDYLLLLRTRRGACALATRYLRDESIREHLVSLAETTEFDVQDRFLRLVRARLDGFTC